MKTVTLHGKKANGRVALVDDEDYEHVSQYRWFVAEQMTPGRRQSGPYAVASVWKDGTRRPLYMHKLITGYARTDHKNHDGLDNRRENLRPATGAQNIANTRHMVKKCSSRFKGVYLDKRDNAWQAYITVAGVRRSLGRFKFDAEEDAARAYDRAAIEAWGPYAYLNFPETEEVLVDPVLASDSSPVRG